MRNLVCVILCLACALGVWAAVGSRHVEKTGGYSFCAPKGWRFRDLPGFKYQYAIGPEADGFSPNINVIDEKYGGTLKSYVDANVATLKKIFTAFTLVKREAFQTTGGVKGERVVTTAKQGKVAVRQTYYFFPAAKKRFLVVSCTALAKHGETLDPVFAESVKTLAVGK